MRRVTAKGANRRRHNRSGRNPIRSNPGETVEIAGEPVTRVANIVTCGRGAARELVSAGTRFAATSAESQAPVTRYPSVTSHTTGIDIARRSRPERLASDAY
jgi:hypothetical protein